MKALNPRRHAHSTAADPQFQAEAAINAATRVVLGKAGEIKLALTCLLARGHLLIEDLPGVGKTTLAHLLARLLGLDFQRVQFTSDLLPADVTGVYVYNREGSNFVFHRGPIFTNVVLADEINRATPRSQSALLEAMEEQQVTIEGRTHALPEPFFVIATQNPLEQVGTFPLPESQLDRFLMCMSLGYPDREAERALLSGEDRRTLLAELAPVLDAESLVQLQLQVDQVHISDALLDYVQDLIDYSRQSNVVPVGLSPRAGLALIRASKAFAMVSGRNHVLPDDVQAIFPAVAAHRLRSATDERSGDRNVVVRAILEAVAIP